MKKIIYLISLFLISSLCFIYNYDNEKSELERKISVIKYKYLYFEKIIDTEIEFLERNKIDEKISDNNKQYFWKKMEVLRRDSKDLEESLEFLNSKLKDNILEEFSVTIEKANKIKYIGNGTNIYENLDALEKKMFLLKKNIVENSRKKNREAIMYIFTDFYFNKKHEVSHFYMFSPEYKQGNLVKVLGLKIKGAFFLNEFIEPTINLKSELKIIDSHNIIVASFNRGIFNKKLDQIGEYVFDVFQKNMVDVGASNYKIVSNIDIQVIFFLSLIEAIIILGILKPVYDKIFNLLKENKKNYDRSVKDHLTGLFNRRGFYENMTFNNESVGIAIIDIDNFKNVNDTYGHDNGDEVLKAVANAMSSNVRDSDIAVRWGGEEFFLLFKNIEKNLFLERLNKIRKEIEKNDFEHLYSCKGLKVTISVGAYHGIINDIEKFNLCLSNADKNLYYAKNHGKNQVVLNRNELEKITRNKRGINEKK